MDRIVKLPVAALAVALVAATPTALPAQVPGAPVLQNAFASEGLVLAGNFGSGQGRSFFGAAAGYGLGGGRVLLSGAAGVQRASSASRGAYGARVSVAVLGSNVAPSSFGVSAFAGIGGAARTRDQAGVTTNRAVMNIPVGASLGYRTWMGNLGVSGYASPLYRWARLEGDTASGNDSGFGVSVGVDVGISRSIGASVGAEFGSSGGTGGSALWGLAISFVPGR